PSLRRIDAKLNPAWMVRWIQNPHAFRPRTRMPNFGFDQNQAVQIAAFLRSASRAPSTEWVDARPEPQIAAGGDLAATGKELVDTLGCRACHALSPDEVAGQLGANKDIAPNLPKVAEKTSGQWMYHWIKTPRGYSAVARMPNLRLTDDQAKAITAYLLTLGEPKDDIPDLQARLANPENIAAG